MPHTQTHDGHERDTHTSRARRGDTNKRRQSSNRSRTDLHTERERGCPLHRLTVGQRQRQRDIERELASLPLRNRKQSRKL